MLIKTICYIVIMLSEYKVKTKGTVTLGKYLIKTFHITFKNLIETITKLPSYNR